MNWDFFFGGMYYYLINCFFIGVGTWILSIVLGYQKYYLEKVEKRNKKDILIITIISLLVLFPSILLTQKKWNAEKFKSDAEEYIDTIQKQNPELAIVNYKAEEENGEKFLDITILNDQNFIDSQKLDAADLLNKEIKLRWHYAPNSKATEINYLQQQINELKKELEKK